MLTSGAMAGRYAFDGSETRKGYRFLASEGGGMVQPGAV
jgi:hypothetical protein